MKTHTMKCPSFFLFMSILRSLTIFVVLGLLCPEQVTCFTKFIGPAITSLRGSAGSWVCRSNPWDEQLLVRSFSLYSPSSPSSTTTTIQAASSIQASALPFKDFDYNAHWYPVSWAHDLILNEPTKVTVFDVDYVVARISETEVICMQDRCPHKAAALSQGRVTSTGNFQW